MVESSEATERALSLFFNKKLANADKTNHYQSKNTKLI